MKNKKILISIVSLLLLGSTGNNFAQKGHRGGGHRGGHRGGGHRGGHRGGSNFGFGFGLGTGFGLLGAPYYDNYYSYDYYPYYDYDYRYEHDQLQDEYNELVEKFNNLLSYTKELENRAENLKVSGYLQKTDRFNYREKKYFERGHGGLKRKLRQLADEYNELVKYTKELEEKIKNKS